MQLLHCEFDSLRLLHLDENSPTCLCFGINDSLFHSFSQMFDDQDLGFFSDFLGIFHICPGDRLSLCDGRPPAWRQLNRLAQSFKGRATTCVRSFAEMRWRLEHAPLTSPPVYDMALRSFLLVISSRTHRCFVLSWISSCTKRRRPWLLTDGDCNNLVRVMKLGSFTVPLLGCSWLWKIKAHTRTLNSRNQSIVHRQTRCPTGT